MGRPAVSRVVARETAASFRKPLSALSCATSDSHFKQPAGKNQSSAAPVSARRGVRRYFPPRPRGQSADKRWCGSPHPVACLTAKPVPSAEGNSRSITRTGAPIGASPRHFP